MNFLAHCALAQDASDCWTGGHAMRGGLLAGAILADFGKGRIDTRLPLELQAGIRLHRRIDAFTNQHELIRSTCAAFPADLRRYAPIFIDILGDYYLSQMWDIYYAEPRTQFSQRCYHACATYADHLMTPGQRNCKNSCSTCAALICWLTITTGNMSSAACTRC